MFEQYQRVLSQHYKLALGTSIDNIPNVRIVNFCFKDPSTLYFTSVRGNQKIAEFDENCNIAFTTVPDSGFEHVRSKTACAKRSVCELKDVSDIFLKQVPGFDQTIVEIGELLDLFEINIKSATVILGVNEEETFSFD